jgi:hypothetical protein
MRLVEFADTKPYTPSADDVADFLKQLDRSWPRAAVAYVLGIRKPATNRQRKPDAL